MSSPRRRLLTKPYPLTDPHITYIIQIQDRLNSILHQTQLENNSFAWKELDWKDQQPVITVFTRLIDNFNIILTLIFSLQTISPKMFIFHTLHACMYTTSVYCIKLIWNLNIIHILLSGYILVIVITYHDIFLHNLELHFGYWSGIMLLFQPNQSLTRGCDIRLL